MAILKSKQARAGHAAGIFSDMTLDGPEIGTLVAVVDRAKNLPNRKTIGKQDPYCAMRLGKEAKKTDTDRRGGQTPRWDQELRFTVHDSPDYYKLKCSVFNDDKKTDLIGESWVDLTDVIKVGGGQNDLWHQLSFKGKYAGDLRMELTFYDTREKPAEKKKQKERHDLASVSDSTSDLFAPGPRSLGPREIKRRPLPMNPVAATPAATRTRSITIENLRPELPPKLPIEEPPQHSQVIHAPIPTRPRGSSASPRPEQQAEHHLQNNYEPHDQQEQNNPYSYYQQAQQVGESHSDPYSPQNLQQQQQQESQPEVRSIQYQAQDLYNAYGNPNALNDRVPYPCSQDQQYQQPHSSPYPDESEIWQSPQSMLTHSAPITPLGSSPAQRPLPPSHNSDSQMPRYRQSPLPDYVRQPYVDSPLRQSINNQDVDLAPVSQSVSLPPLPPKHHEVTPRRPRNEYPPSAYIPQPQRVSGNRSSVPERSPLQAFEDEHLSYRRERLADPRTPARHSMYETHHEQIFEQPGQHEQPRQQLELYGRRRTYDEQPRSSDPQLPQSRRNSFEPARRSSYDPRQTMYNDQVTDEPQFVTPRDGYQSGYEDAYQPFVEDAPPSPGLQPAVARKAVGAQPKRLTGVPFGPDAYDVLNPASSPVTNVDTKFQTPEQAKEAERFKEVEKIRELGPIIGNDGRVIDPSDHLPSDTWAPEPERKNRKPEHVIHIRTKNDSKRPSGARGSPMVVRHNGPQSVYSSPAAERDSSPITRIIPNKISDGRNRLQKPAPASVRPLPNQPYQSPLAPTASSPALASSPQDMYEGRRPSFDRRGSYENRGSVARPPLSAYQVSVGNGYAPRTGSYDRASQRGMDDAYETPSKQSSYQTYASPATHERRGSYDARRNSYDRRNMDYVYNERSPYDVPPVQPRQARQSDDPLAAEMSLIDIGPSRRGPQSGYHSGALVKSRGRW